MNKFEKLKEVNAMLKRILINMETYIFIENINIDKNKENELKVIAEIKQ
jgi:hypothetical protein